MFGVGRDLCGSSSPIPLLKQGHLQQATQDLVQADLEYLQRRRLHNLPGQPVPGLCHPQSEEVLPRVQRELPMLQFVPVAPCGSLWILWLSFSFTGIQRGFSNYFRVVKEKSVVTQNREWGEMSDLLDDWRTSCVYNPALHPQQARVLATNSWRRRSCQ